MSIQVSIRVNPKTSQQDWALYSDETLSKCLDWYLCSVIPVSLTGLYEDSNYEVGEFSTAVWVYTINPFMVIDDLLRLLKDLTSLGHSVSVCYPEPEILSPAEGAALERVSVGGSSQQGLPLEWLPVRF